MTYRWCLVPGCNNNTKNTPEKLFISVPTKSKMRKIWLEATRRDPNEISATLCVYICEDHFDETETYKIFEYERKLLILSGFYLIKPEKNAFLFYCSRVINWGFNFSLLLSSMFLMILEEVEITILTACWLMSITQAAFLLKLLIFYLKKYDLKEIENFLLAQEPFCNESAFKSKVIEKNLNICRRMFLAYRIFCFVTCLGYALCPYIDKGHLLVLPGYIPWDIIKYNLITNLLQAFTISSSAYINSSLDTLAVSLFTVGIVHLENLNDQLKEFDYTEPEEDVAKKFKTMIFHHQNIIKFVRKVEKLFGYGLFFQFAASVGVICMTGFQLLVIETFSIEFTMLTSYFMCMMTQVYILTKTGQILTIQSHELVRSFYMSNWYESSPRIRRLMFIFLERCKKPIVCTAGNFFTLSLATLITIIKSSYSYYAVLRSIYIKNSENM